jgi:hypothetical protein
MFKKVLVADLIEDGSELLEALKRARFPIAAAVWYDVPELEWRLVIVTTAVDRNGPMAAYGKVQRALQSFPARRLALSDVMLISPHSPDFQNLQMLLSTPGRFGQAPATGRARNISFEDAYIYPL